MKYILISLIIAIVLLYIYSVIYLSNHKDIEDTTTDNTTEPNYYSRKRRMK